MVRRNALTKNSLGYSYCHSYCHHNHADCSQFLLWAEYARNSIRKPATGLTPFKCLLGYQPPPFPWSGEPTELPAVDNWLQRSEDVWNEAHVHLQRAVRCLKEQADHSCRPHPSYHPGQWVWLSTQDLRLQLPCRKLSPWYVGPFKIIRQITLSPFRLSLPSSYRISPTFHVSLLAPREERRTIIVEGEEANRVHELLDSRHQAITLWTGRGSGRRNGHGSIWMIS